MNEPLWIGHADVLEIHRLQLDEHDGLADVRDPGLLSSALHRPLNVWNYAAGADLASMAAAYAAGIARNHPFLDGNKRTAAVVCETFIRLNKRQLAANDEQWYSTVLALASGELTEQEFAEWLRERLVVRE